VPSDGVGSLPHTRKVALIKRCPLACQQEGGPSVGVCRPWASGDSLSSGAEQPVLESLSGSALSCSEFNSSHNGEIRRVAQTCGSLHVCDGSMAD
jgi:hypothetical protein